MDTPGAKELLGMIKRLETLAKERIALAEVRAPAHRGTTGE